MTFKFSNQNLDKINEIFTRYKTRKSAIMNILYLAQEQNDGWLSNSCIIEIAKILDLNPIEVLEVASFYTMFNLKPVTKYHIQVCTTTPCWLRGSDEILSECQKSNFTVTEVECLGACINAPVVQINNEYHENLTPNKISQIINQLTEQCSLETKKKI